MEKEHFLREDRRLLGRLLGEVIADQVGEQARGRIEAIRETAVRFRRTGEPAAVKAELEALLDALPIDEALHVVRAFSYFSHLLNIAEDTQQNRRRHAHAEAGSPDRPGSFAFALSRISDAQAALEIRSEEHTSELQSWLHLVCRLLLEKKKNINYLYMLR